MQVTVFGSNNTDAGPSIIINPPMVDGPMIRFRLYLYHHFYYCFHQQAPLNDPSGQLHTQMYQLLLRLVQKLLFFCILTPPSKTGTVITGDVIAQSNITPDYRLATQHDTRTNINPITSPVIILIIKSVTRFASFIYKIEASSAVGIFAYNWYSNAHKIYKAKHFSAEKIITLSVGVLYEKAINCGSRQKPGS